MEKLRIDSGTKKVEVNDEGEYILLPLSDNSFTVGFYRLLEDVNRSGETLPVDITGAVDGVEQIVEIEKHVKERVDALFGPETCRKVFGDITPSLDLFVEFFGALVPFFEEHKEARMRKMGKYAAERTGSSL